MRLQQVVWFESLPLGVVLACCRLLHVCRPCAWQGALAHCPCRHTRSETEPWPQAHKTASSRTPSQRGDSRQYVGLRGTRTKRLCKTCQNVWTKFPSNMRTSQTCHAKRGSMWPSPTPAMQSEGGCHQVPRLPRETQVDVTKCNACHANATSMSQVPSLPHKWDVHVAKCHAYACHATTKGPQAPHHNQPSAISARLASETKVDVAKCHACHTKRREMSPTSATPAAEVRVMGDQGAPSAPPEPAQCHKCHACHVKWRSMSPSAMPAKMRGEVAKCHVYHAKCCGVTASKGPQARYQSQPSAISATPATQSEVDVAKCHASHETTGDVAKCRLPRKVPRRHGRSSAISATPATRNEGQCCQVPRMPHKTTGDVAKCHVCQAKCCGVTGDQGAPSALPEPAQCHKCHACHTQLRSMSPSARPNKQNDGRCRQVPHLPPKWKVDVPSVWQSCVWQSCVWKWQRGVWQSCVCVCDKVTKLCVKNGVWQSCVWKMVCDKVCVTKLCVKDGVWQSFVWQSCVWQRGVCDKVVCVKVWKMVCDKVCVTKRCVTKRCVTKLCVKKLCVTKFCVTKLCVKDGVWQRGVWQSCVWKMVWKMVCDKVCVTKLCVTKRCVTKLCGKKLCVTKFCVTKFCVKDGVWQSCVWQNCVWKMVYDKEVCDKVVCVWQGGGGEGGGRGGRGEAGYRIKSKNPTQRCG